MNDNLRNVGHCPQCGKPVIGVPVLRCADCGSEHPLRAWCYEAAPGRFIAECIDLDLLSQGSTPEEAIGALQEAMVDYLQAAFAGGSVRGLVPRPSPRSNRFRYHWTRTLGHLSQRIRGRHRHLAFRPVVSGESDNTTVRLAPAHC